MSIIIANLSYVTVKINNETCTYYFSKAHHDLSEPNEPIIGSKKKKIINKFDATWGKWI